MAQSYAAPHIPALPRDRVTFEEAAAMLADTPYPKSAATLKRYIKRREKDEGVKLIWRIDRRDYVSNSDVLEVHRDEIARQT